MDPHPFLLQIDVEYDLLEPELLVRLGILPFASRWNDHPQDHPHPSTFFVVHPLVVYVFLNPHCHPNPRQIHVSSVF